MPACITLFPGVFCYTTELDEMVVEVVAVESQAGGSCFSVYFLAPLSS